MLWLIGLVGSVESAKLFILIPALRPNSPRRSPRARIILHKEDSLATDRRFLSRFRGHAILNAIKILRGGFVRRIPSCCFLKSAGRLTQKGRNSCRYPEAQLSAIAALSIAVAV